MSLSPDTTSSVGQARRRDATQTTFVFPMILFCVALALILISAVFSPITLETPGIESFLVGP
jgi:hypothetical protein